MFCVEKSSSVVGFSTQFRGAVGRAPASVAGNISTPCLVIHEGVVFEGHCAMGGAAAGRAERTDKRVAIFPAEGGTGRRSSEAAG